MLVITILGAPVMTARERVHRLFDQTSGLVVPTVFSLAQDAEGFIWIGTAGGLVRYDGDQMRPWAKDVINRDVFTLLASPTGEVFVAEGTGTLYRITASSVELVTGPEGKPFRDVWSGSIDGLGRLWVVTAEREVHYRERDLTWRRYDLNAFPGERVNVVEPGKDDRIYILTNKAVWLMRGGESPKKLLDVVRPRNVVEHPDGSLFILAWQVDGEIIELRDGRAVNRVSVPARPIDMTLRGGVVWGSFSHYLVALRSDEPPDMIGPESDLPSGGPLLVDHEGSLWVGTFGGLIQYPEPETTIWSQKDGLSGSHTRTLAQTEEGIWVGIWGHLGRISREANEWRVYNEKLDSLPCIDQNGELFIGAPPGGVMQRRDGRFVKYSSLPASDARLHSCTRARDGTLLFTTGRGIFAAQPDRSAPKLLSTPSGEDGQPGGIHRILEDGQRLWAAT
jgi:ligand-binding sensor domain-containing protein